MDLSSPICPVLCHLCLTCAFECPGPVGESVHSEVTLPRLDMGQNGCPL